MDKREIARQVVVNAAAGLASAGGPVVGAIAAGAAPIVLGALDWMSVSVNDMRMDNATETVTDAAGAYGAETEEEFANFIRAIVSDKEHLELLARALTVAQDTASRDKRRALGRALASAASEKGTKVDDELLFIRVLADLDPPHIRCLWIMRSEPPHQDAVNRQRKAIGEAPVRQWHPSDIAAQDPGLTDAVWALLPVLARHQLISGGYEVLTWAGREPEYIITSYGEWLLDRLAEPE